MRNFIAKLKLVLDYGPEIDEILQRRRLEKSVERAKEDRHQLNLCYRHRQEEKHSHYSDHNCDYCKALKGKRRIFDETA